mgnify:CR=1 FL=1
MDIILDNNAFEQELAVVDQDSFNARRKKSTTRRRTVRRVSRKAPRGQKVYSKSGKARLGRWVRV